MPRAGERIIYTYKGITIEYMVLGLWQKNEDILAVCEPCNFKEDMLLPHPERPDLPGYHQSKYEYDVEHSKPGYVTQIIWKRIYDGECSPNFRFTELNPNLKFADVVEKEGANGS